MPYGSSISFIVKPIQQSVFFVLKIYNIARCNKISGKYFGVQFKLRYYIVDCYTRMKNCYCFVYAMVV